MIKWLCVLSLILGLIAPHGATAHPDSQSHDHDITDRHLDPAPAHSGKTGPKHCCDASVGGCVLAALVGQSADWTMVANNRSLSFQMSCGIVDSIKLSFDPPPPRV